MFGKSITAYIRPMAAFLGGTIGVGFLALPYIATKAGLLVTLGYFVVVTILMVVINLIFTEISLKTPDFKRFPGFVKHHLGSLAGALVTISFVAVSFGVLLAFLIVGGEFLTALLQPYFGGSILVYTFLAFLVGSCLIYFDGKVISKVETLVMGVFFAAICLMMIALAKFVRLENVMIAPQLSLKTVFLPYGPLLFSLWGAGFIPGVEELVQKKKDLKKIIAIGTIFIAVFYLIFTLFFVGLEGVAVAPFALIGSGFDGLPLLLAVIAGAAVALNAFVAQGNMLKEILVFDIKIPSRDALLITVCSPMILFLLGWTSFISIISFIGGVFLGIDGIIILLMYRKIGGRPVLVYPLLLVFVLGIVYEIFYGIK